MNHDSSLESLSELVQFSPDAVVLVRNESIAYLNPAAQKLFRIQLTGAPMSQVMPGLDLRCSNGPYAASVTVMGVSCQANVQLWNGVTLLTLRRQTPPAPVPPAVIRALRASATELRFSLDRISPDQPEEDVSRMYHSYYSLLHSIEQLTDRNQVAKNELFCRNDYVDMRKLIKELSSSLEYYLPERTASLTCHLSDGLSIVLGDRDRLEQLLLILLSNALRHAPPDGHVRLSLHSTWNRCVVFVEDDGPGLSDADMAEVFLPRMDDEKPSASGSGLGLYIAQGITRACSGTLMLENLPKKGVRVTLSLPLKDVLLLRDAPGGKWIHSPRRILTELSDLLPSQAYRREDLE